ncbi:MAG: 3-hydroxyisobutyryl-CoA hydrolase [Devosia sp.]
MTGQLEVGREGSLGIIALNRPEAINALNFEMVRGITGTLEQWRDDDGIRAVLFEGRGPRGFCAGGDVRAARQQVLDGTPEAADAFFAAEYFMNGLIATFRKPTVALSHGIVMGGGIGIAGHCRYRFTTPDAKFAMPEAAIGFVSDIGINHIMGKAPLHRALLFLLSGVTVGPADALALGLADCVYDPARRAALLGAVAAAAAADEPELALLRLVQAEMLAGGEEAFVFTADAHAGLDWSDPAAIVDGVADPMLSAALKARSPTSLVAILESHLAARRLPGIGEVLAADLALAQLLCRWPDFAEGVRAVLVDRDGQPRWQPPGLEAVPRAAIRAAIAAATGSQLV